MSRALYISGSERRNLVGFALQEPTSRSGELTERGEEAGGRTACAWGARSDGLRDSRVMLLAAHVERGLVIE